MQRRLSQFFRTFRWKAAVPCHRRARLEVEALEGRLTPASHLMFASSIQFSIDSDSTVPPPNFPAFGGIAAADWSVTFLAAAAGLIPNWNGVDIVYRAVLSDANVDAVNRFEILGPLFNTNGDVVANDAGDLWDGDIANPVGFDEYGNAITTSTWAWTGSTRWGTYSGASAGNWLDPSTTTPAGEGDVLFTSASWQEWGIRSGHSAARLYAISPALGIAPVVDAGPDGNVAPGVGFSRNGSFTDPGDVYWVGNVNYGDGSGTLPLTIDFATRTFELGHTYSTPGTYTVTVTIDDSDASTPADTDTFEVVVAPPTASHRIFASSIQFSIDSNTTVPPPNFPAFGGIAAADWSVTFLAAAAGLIPNWNGVDIVYRAVLSDANVDAVDRFEILGPLFNTNGDVVANDAADLWDGDIANPVGFDEKGNAISSSLSAWTGSTRFGTYVGTSAGNWSNPSGSISAGEGNPASVSAPWLESSVRAGDSAARLYAISPALGIAPVVDAGPDGNVAPGAAFSRNGSFTDPGDVYWVGTVNYGDGSSTLPLTIDFATRTFQLVHTYSTPGTYTVTVILDDSDPSTLADTATFDVVVSPPASSASSNVHSLASYSPASFLVSWSGNNNGGPAIVSYDVYVSENNGPFTFWQNSTQTSADFAGVHGRRYAFYSVAIDSAGSREATPIQADATTTVVASWLTKNTETFTDADGDRYTVKLSGAGRVAVVRNGGVISEIIVDNTDAAKPRLTLSVTVRKVGDGNGTTTIAAVSGSGALTINALACDLTGAGINLSGPLVALMVRDIKNGAGIKAGGAAIDKTKISARAVHGGTHVDLGSTLTSLKAVEFGAGSILAAVIGKLTTKGDDRLGSAGKFDADIGSPSQRVGLQSAKIAGGISDGIWRILGDVSSISVAGAASNWELDISGSLAKAAFATVDNASSVTARAIKSLTTRGDFNAALTLTGTNDAKKPTLHSATINGSISNAMWIIAGANIANKITINGNVSDWTVAAEQAVINTLNVNGVKGSTVAAFVNSDIAARKLGRVKLASAQTQNGGDIFGIMAEEIGGVRVIAPAFIYNPADPASQGHVDFQVVNI